jgi:hypothetical protein
MWITAIRNIKKMKNYLTIMDLVLIVIIKIIFVSVDQKIVLVLLVREGSRWRLKKQANI